MANELSFNIEATDNASVKINQVNDALIGTGKAADQADQPLDDLGKQTQKNTSYAQGFAMKMMGVNQTLELVERGARMAVDAFEFAEAGAQIQKLDDDFEKLAISIGSTGYVLENDLSAKTRGMIADARLVSGAVDMMSLGLAKTHDQAVRLTAVASQLNMNMDALTLTLTNQTEKRFDTLNMKVDGFDDKLQALKDTGMDVNDAFTEAFLQQAEEQVALLGNSADSAIAPFQQLGVQVQNLVDDVKVAAANIFGPLAQSLGEFMSVQNNIRNAGYVISEAVDLGLMGYWEGEWAALTATNEEWYALAEEMEKLIAEHNQTIEANIDSVVEMERAEMEAAGATRRASVEREIATATGNEYAQFYEHMTDATREAITAFEDLEEPISIADALTASLNGNLDEQIANMEEMAANGEDTSGALAEINGELLDMTGRVAVLQLLESGLEGSEQAAYDMALSMGLMDEATYNANMTMANLIDYLEDTGDVDGYALAVSWIADNLDRLQDKTFTITQIIRTITQGASYAPGAYGGGGSMASGDIGQMEQQLGKDLNGNGIIGAANGFRGMVTEPTMFVVAEGGKPEYVDINPTPAGSYNGGGGGNTYEFHFHGPVAGSQSQLERMFEQAARKVFREQEAYRR